MHIWHGQSIKDKFGDYKAIVSLDTYDELTLSNDITRVVKDINSGFISYYDSNRLYCIDNDSMNTMIQTGSNNIESDYSIMFDTNFTSYIDRFVRTGSPGVSENRVYMAIDMLLKNNYQYDYNFYLLENTKIITDFDRADNYQFELNNEHFENIVSMELFKSIKRDVYMDTGKLEYSISYDMARSQAKYIVDSLYKSEQGKSFCNSIIMMQKQILLNLIGMVRINFTSNNGARKKAKEFFTYIKNVSGIYMEREVIIAYKYFDKNKKLAIFKKINKGIKSNKLYSLLSNIAWDFTIPRFMERILSTCGEGDYFLPILLSIDSDLRELLRLFPVKASIFHKHNLKLLPIPSKSSIEYFTEKKCEDDFIKLFDEREKRINVLRVNQNDNYKIIQKEYKKLEKIICHNP